ncbi:MAG: hypothetical protein WB290_05550 [Smithella sp.]
MKKWSKIHTNTMLETKPVRIVADAAIATRNLNEDRLIPLVILDTTERPDIEELIRIHAYITPGDVMIQWAKLKNSEGTIVLILSFKRPSELSVVINFDIVKQGILVDQILTSKGLYIQAGRDGDRFITNPHAKKIIIEIPDTGFLKTWDQLFHSKIMNDMRNNGLGRHQAKNAATMFINELRKFGKLRVGQS